VPGATPLDVRMDDIRAVMDAVGSESAAVMGESEGGPLGILFAAAHPERTRALILQGGEVRERTDEEWPWGEATVEEFETNAATVAERWGKTGRGVAARIPSLASDPGLPAIEAWWVKVQRNSATPAAWEAFQRMAFDIDVRDVVPSIHVPTLLIHATGDRVCHVENARWVAQHIDGARLVELPGGDHLPWFHPDRTLAEIREFITGSREPEEPDRVLATILFTDVVGSTELAAKLGDGRWRDLLESHNEAVRAELARYRGREVDTAGDGFLAVFDGPARAIRAANAIVESVRRLGLEVRAGIHTGEIEQLPTGDIRGIAVHTGARVAATAGPGEVLVSSSVRDLVAGSGLAFQDRGSHVLKGIEEERRLYAVAPT
jgi:class 3 adenylate cyclase